MNFIKTAIKEQKKYIVSYWILNLLLTLVSLIIPLIEAKMLDVLVYTKNYNDFWKWIVLEISLVFVQIFVSYFSNKISSVSTSNFALDFNQKILDFLFESNTRKVMMYEPTYLHARVLQDTESCINFYYSTISNVINNIAIWIFTIIVLVQINKYIVLSVFIFCPVYAFIFLIFKGRMKDASLEQSEASNSCYAARSNIYVNYLDIKAKKNEFAAKEFLKQKEGYLLRSIKRMFRLKFYLSSTQLIVSSLFQIGGFIIGGLAVMAEKMTLGVFFYLLQYFSMMLNTVEEFLNIGTNYQSYKASMTRLGEVLEIEKESNGEIKLEHIDQIELKNINYCYEKEDGNLYSEDINMLFESGKLYNILGENGVGKTTLILMMLGIYKDGNQKGSILYNGIEYGKIDMNFVRKNKISIMMQNNISFEGTVEEYIKSSLSEEEYRKELKNDRYEEVFFNTQFNLFNILKKKFDCLSGGEKQLVNLFVCLAKQASVFFLDEPTANIYSGLKEGILSLLQCKAKENKIIIMITHDKDMVSKSISLQISQNPTQ